MRWPNFTAELYLITYNRIVAREQGWKARKAEMFHGTSASVDHRLSLKKEDVNVTRAGETKVALVVKSQSSCGSPGSAALWCSAQLSGRSLTDLAESPRDVSDVVYEQQPLICSASFHVGLASNPASWRDLSVLKALRPLLLIMAIFNLKALVCRQAAALYCKSNVYPEIAIALELCYINVIQPWRKEGLHTQSSSFTTAGLHSTAAHRCSHLSQWAGNMIGPCRSRW